MMFSIGDTVKLYDYSRHDDWKEHKDQMGTIYDLDNSSYPLKIKWENGGASAAPISNVFNASIPINTSAELQVIIRNIVMELRSKK